MNMEQQLHAELAEHLVPFWRGMRDEAHGGFYGRMDCSLKIDKTANKHAILNSRILWFFSKAAMCLEDESLIDDARAAYAFLDNHLIDRQYGGVIWSAAFDGTPCDTGKHTYNQAFAIYALSAYYEATGDERALESAYALFGLIERRCTDEQGYLEAFTRDFAPATNDKLSENGVIAARTMNTLLHVFEAYAGLYEVDGHARVKRAMVRIVELFLGRIYNFDLRRQEVFLGADYRPLIDLTSYGHDIESAWLLDWGCSLLRDQALSERLLIALDGMTEQVYASAFDGSSLANECENGATDETRIWWVQAEAMVGFMNAYERHPKRSEYFDAVRAIWAYIKAHLIDTRAGGEWFWDVDARGRPASGKDIVGPWKCPYHNGRMLIEMIGRLRTCGTPNI